MDLNSLTEKNLTNKQSRVALSTSLGPCPKFPVYNSTTVLNRCVPLPLKEIASQLISNLYSVLNAWDTIDSILGDLFTCWREILVLTFVALGKSFFFYLSEIPSYYCDKIFVFSILYINDWSITLHGWSSCLGFYDYC